MAVRNRLTVFILILIIFSASPAQLTSTPPATGAQAEKQKAAEELQNKAYEMLEQVGNSVSMLKLSENRAYMYAAIGDIVWKNDEKLGRKLFRDAANEIVQANNTPRETSATQQSLEITFGRPEILSLRRMVLQAAAVRDAEMALELLAVTRPADLALDMQNYVPPPTLVDRTAGIPISPPTQQTAGNMRAQQEIMLEQSLIRKAAEQDPEKAAKLIRELWSKGITTEIIGLVQKIAQKDSKLANSLLAATVQKLGEIDLAKSNSELNTAVFFLRTFAMAEPAAPADKSAQPLKIESIAAKDLANKIADALLRLTANNDTAFRNALTILQKLAPERVAQVKQKQAALKNQKPAAPSGTAGAPRPGQNNIPASLSDPNATAETLAADALKVQGPTRRSFYEKISGMATISGDLEGARSLLQNAPQSKERDDVINQLNAKIAQKALREGKLDEMRKIIDLMPPGNAKVEQIVDLALASYRQNTEVSKDNAEKLLEDAHRMVNNYPGDRDEFDGLIKVVSGYAVIEPDRAFNMLGPVIEQVNEISQASAVLAKYNKQTNFVRDGEMIMTNGLGGGSGVRYSRFGREIKALAQADFERTRSLIDQFRRDDIRLFARLFVAQSILRERVGLEGQN